ncbi:3-hydroxyisobutyrate dehydrogenase [Sulfolobus acidocaldarius DSM 639]|uniref:3-hydroxyisobutyrate dehydrogenase n=1 Tax=Sulfolobus acidocaldarius (strain ATCC 33909 / DSM 639 / JCM 8929 / NBRC 15157 / NCIMB 11770) TaxID=330779 RepID=Q4JBM8_SULAC|nr:3-hydroxyisobutyrate dehydrogenase [Sulfolobus acidocaldarius DSM 639]
MAGLGIMGYRIAANLAKAGKLNMVYNRTVSKAEQFHKEYGVKYAEDPKSLIQSVDFLITMLSDDEAVKSFITPLLPYVKDKIIVDMSTISPSTSISLSNEVSKHGGIMFDTPVIGTTIAVEQKKITVLVGGPKEKFNIVQDVLKETAANVIYVGKNGSALYAKIANNLLTGIYMTALAEAFTFGVRSGLDPEEIKTILSQYASVKSPFMELKLPKVISGDYSTQFATKHMAKDLEIAVRESQNLKVITPLTSISLQLYRLADGLGYGDSDFASVIEVYKKSPKSKSD